MWIRGREVVSDTWKIKLVEIGLWLPCIEWWDLIADCCGLAALTNPIISYLKCIYFGAIHRISFPFAAVRSIDMISSAFNHRHAMRLFRANNGQPEQRQKLNEWCVRDVIDRKKQPISQCLFALRRLIKSTDSGRRCLDHFLLLFFGR